MEIEIRRQAFKASENHYYRVWHETLLGDYEIKYKDSHKIIGSFSLATTVSGCGTVMMYGYYLSDTSIPHDGEIGIEIKRILGLLKKDGVGAVITTIGELSESYGSTGRVIKLFGLEKVATYPNYRHEKDGSYTQSLFIANLTNI